MSKFFLAKGEIKSKYQNAICESSRLLVATHWDKLYSFEREDMYLSWTNSGDTSSFYKEDDDIIVLVGKLFGVKDVGKKLKEILSNIAAENYLETLKELDGTYCLIVKKADTLIVSNDIIAGDPLVYYFEGESNNLLLSTDLKILRNICALGINALGILEKLMCFCTVNNTSLEKVKVLESDIALKITPHSSTKNVLARISGISRYQDYTEPQLLEQLDSLLDTSMKGYNISNCKFSLSLSGGVDSRFLLGGMRKNIKDSDILALTFSTKKNTEHIIATKVCKMLGILHETLYFKEFSLKNIEKFLWQTEELSVVDSLFYSEYIDFMHQWGLPVTNGFMLDALSGHPTRFWYDESKNYTNPSLVFTQQAAKGIFHAEYIKEDLRVHLKHNISKGAKKLFATIDSHYASVKRKLALFNLFTLQKTWNNNIALSINLSGSGIIPVNNRGFINFWLNIPVRYTANQYLYRKYISLYLKDIACVESTYDLQKIDPVDSRLKQINFFIKKQLYRLTRSYHVPEVIVKNKKILHQYMMDNRVTLFNYFTNEYIEMIGKELKGRTKFSKAMSKIFGKQLADEALIIPINIIFFEKMLKTPISPVYKPKETIEL